MPIVYILSCCKAQENDKVVKHHAFNFFDQNIEELDAFLKQYLNHIDIKFLSKPMRKGGLSFFDTAIYYMMSHIVKDLRSEVEFTDYTKDFCDPFLKVFNAVQSLDLDHDSRALNESIVRVRKSFGQKSTPISAEELSQAQVLLFQIIEASKYNEDSHHYEVEMPEFPSYITSPSPTLSIFGSERGSPELVHFGQKSSQSPVSFQVSPFISAMNAEGYEGPIAPRPLRSLDLNAHDQFHGYDSRKLAGSARVVEEDI